MSATLHSVPNAASKSVANVGYVRVQTQTPVIVRSATSGRWLPKLARTLFSAKPVQSVAYYTDTPERTACRWMSGAVDPPSRALISLIRSDHGWRVLCHVMRDSKQAWWIKTVDAVHAAEEDQLQLTLPL